MAVLLLSCCLYLYIDTLRSEAKPVLGDLMVMKVIEILGIIVAAVSGYILVTGEFNNLPYLHLLLGVMLLALGIRDYKERYKSRAVLVLIVSGFGLFTGVYTLLI